MKGCPIEAFATYFELDVRGDGIEEKSVRCGQKGDLLSFGR